MSAAREAQPSEGPQGPTPRESHEATRPNSQSAASQEAEAMRVRGEVDL